MIRKQAPASMVEVLQIMKYASIENQELEDFIKKFVSLKAKDSQAMTKELEALQFAKMKDAEVVKVIDFLPEDAQDLNKIFTDVGLDEDEQNKILEIVKKYK